MLSAKQGVHRKASRLYFDGCSFFSSQHRTGMYLMSHLRILDAVDGSDSLQTVLIALEMFEPYILPLVRNTNTHSGDLKVKFRQSPPSTLNCYQLTFK